MSSDKPSPPTNSSKPNWLQFLESAGGTALITALVGGIFAQIINVTYQERSQERELRQSWIKARADQALVAHKEYLDGELKTVTEAFEVLGGMTSATQALITITGKAWDPELYGESASSVTNQKDAIRNRFNAADDEWRRRKESIGLQMSYYHHGGQGVSQAWRSVQDAADKFNECAQMWYLDHLTNLVDDISNVCTGERVALTAQLDALNVSLESGRTHVWEGWETPEALTSALSSAK